MVLPTLYSISSMNAMVGNHGKSGKELEAVIWGLNKWCGGECPVGPPPPLPTSPVIWAPPEAIHTDFQEFIPEFKQP